MLIGHLRTILEYVYIQGVIIWRPGRLLIHASYQSVVGRAAAFDSFLVVSGIS